MGTHLNGLVGWGLVSSSWVPLFIGNEKGGQLEQSQIVDPVHKIAGTGWGSQVSWPLSRAELVFQGGEMGLK